MKPGTLVMLISHGGVINIDPDFPNIGAVGDVQEVTQGMLSEIPSDNRYTVVMFPRHPSNTISGVWYVPSSWLIPISDPDIDLTEETEDSLSDELATEH